jgi:very-short-patch-repair endonuclease
MPSPEVETARYLRRNRTVVEARMWDVLRGKKLGVKFRRQHPIGPYVADFARVSAKLVVEIDGDTHRGAYDEHRDRYLESRGWRVMRMFLQDVDEGPDDVAATILLEIEQPGTMLTYEARNRSVDT